jgi:Fur family transcriptional regulator, ferric uptake regulator
MTDAAVSAAPLSAATPSSLPSLDEVGELLVRHGHRMTEPRRVVAGAVLEQARPFTAEGIVALVRERAPDVGRATVYRTLELLASLDVLTRVLRSDGHPAYIAGAPGHRHHLVCSGCGETVAFSACPVDDLVRDLSRDTSFRIHGHLLEVFGECPACQPATAG